MFTVPVLDDEQEAELERLEKAEADRQAAKLARYLELKQKEADRLTAVEAAKAKAKASSRKIEAAKVKRFADNVNQFIEDPAGKNKKKKVATKETKKKIESNRSELSSLPFPAADNDDLSDNFYNGALNVEPVRNIVLTPSGLATIGIDPNISTTTAESETNPIEPDNDDEPMEETVST